MGSFFGILIILLGKIRKEITEELPSGSLEASVLKSFEDFVNQQVNDVYVRAQRIRTVSNFQDFNRKFIFSCR